MPRITSLRQKLTLSHITTVLVCFCVAAFFITINLENRSLKTLESSLITQARLIASQLPVARLTSAHIDPAYLDSFTQQASAISKSRITIIDIYGRVLCDSDRTRKQIESMDNHLGRTEIREALAHGEGLDIRQSPTLKTDFLYAAVPIRTRDGSSIGIVRLAVRANLVNNALYALRKIVWLGLFTALILAAILGILFSGQITKPLHSIIFASQRYSEGDFKHRIISHSQDEMGKLARVLNDMAANLEHKIMEANAQNQKLEAVFNSMIEGIIVTDRAGRIASLNKSIERIFNVNGSDAQGRLLLEAIRNNDLSEIIKTVLDKGFPLSKELLLSYPIQGIFQINAVPIFESAPEAQADPRKDRERARATVDGCLVVVHDISEIRRLETVRRDFVANVSHELKTPLTSIKGFVETLMEGALEDKENNRQFLQIIHDHTERIKDLIDDLLTLSHLESSTISLSKTRFNLRNQCDEVILGFRSQVKKKGIKILNELPSDIEILADKNRITQVFTNLIDNAIKFNKDSGIVKISGIFNTSHLSVIIEDTGLGIPSKDVSRVFERFYRVDKARSRDLGGTGLGLSIVKHIIELHGGTVDVESTEGIGSKFRFTIPA